jgi:hypothetical protein
METARALLEVTAGVIPNRPEPELTKQWAITSAEWQQATEDDAQGILLATRNGQAQGYAAWLMMQPDRVNFVDLKWIWL